VVAIQSVSTWRSINDTVLDESEECLAYATLRGGRDETVNVFQREHLGGSCQYFEDRAFESACDTAKRMSGVHQGIHFSV
jgi:hypothetical protein